MAELIESYTAASGVEFIVLRGELGQAVLWNGMSGFTPGREAFEAEFELDTTDYLGDPNEEHYQGTTFTRIIRRRVDGKVFGASVWWNPGIDSIEGVAVDADLVWDLGIQTEDEDEGLVEAGVVFLPVRAFIRPGWSVDKSGLRS
ncbi:hypothetical protein SEA_CECE_283 [Microbacterium phage Cece]|nr:hypothetical protein SEA_CECE_283 [Microbacterium phage Cece]